LDSLHRHDVDIFSIIADYMYFIQVMLRMTGIALHASLGGGQLLPTTAHSARCGAFILLFGEGIKLGSQRKVGEWGKL